MTDSAPDFGDEWETIGQFPVSSTSSVPLSARSEDVISLQSGISEALSLEVRELEELRERNATLEKANVDLARENADVVSQKDALQDEVKRLHEMLGKKSLELDAYCERYNALEDQHLRLTQSKDVLDREAGGLRIQVACFEEDTIKVAKDKEALVAEKRTLEEQLAQERNAAKLRYEGLRNETVDLNTRFQLGASQENARKLTEQINKLTEQVKSTNVALEQAHKRYTALQSQNIKLAQEKEALIYEKRGQLGGANVAKDLAMVKQALEDSQERCKALQRSNSTLTDENTKIASERDVAQKKVVELENDIKKRDEYMNVIRVRSTAIQKSEAERKRLSGHVKLLTDELKSVRSEGQAVRRTCVDLENKVAALAKENKELKVKALALEGEKGKLEERVDRWKANYDSMHQKAR